jgi:hypothetical protein
MEIAPGAPKFRHIHYWVPILSWLSKLGKDGPGAGVDRQLPRAVYGNDVKVTFLQGADDVLHGSRFGSRLGAQTEILG